MNFIGNKLIPAALFAATASVAISAPAQALNLTGHIAFSGGVNILENENGSEYYFDFADYGSSDVTGFNAFTSQCSGSFTCMDPIKVSDFGISGGVLDNAPVAPFIRNIAANGVNGSSVRFILTGVNTFDVSASGSTSFNLEGFFRDNNDPDKVLALGNFSGEIGEGNTFSGNLHVVPTPAAVLPVIAGLFGAASRKKQEEEA